jgi:O-acetyl-ADP-ribose deacetylase (regulator of RNase III)
VWQGGRYGEPELLRSCYRNSLNIAAEKLLESIAFPAISTGVYAYPMLYATPIAIEEAITFIKENALPGKVIFCVFDKVAENIYQEILAEKLNNI